MVLDFKFFTQEILVIRYRKVDPLGFKWKSEPEIWAKQLPWIMFFMLYPLYYLSDTHYQSHQYTEMFRYLLIADFVLASILGYGIEKMGWFDSGRDWLHRTKHQALANWWLENPDQRAVSGRLDRHTHGFVTISCTEIIVLRGVPVNKLLQDMRILFAPEDPSNQVLESWILNENRRDGDTLSPEEFDRLTNSSLE